MQKISNRCNIKQDRKSQEGPQKVNCRRSISKRTSGLEEGKSYVETIVKHRRATHLWEFLAQSYPDVRRK